MSLPAALLPRAQEQVVLAKAEGLENDPRSRKAEFHREQIRSPEMCLRVPRELGDVSATLCHLQRLMAMGKVPDDGEKGTSSPI